MATLLTAIAYLVLVGGLLVMGNGVLRTRNLPSSACSCRSDDSPEESPSPSLRGLQRRIAETVLFCSLALWRGEREEAAEILPRCEMFLEHLAPFAAERRKALMHAGLQTQGSHYLLYDYSTSAETLRSLKEAGELPKKLEARWRRTLLREVEACRNADGSYVDNPLIGVHGATGLAILALSDLTS